MSSVTITKGEKAAVLERLDEIAQSAGREAGARRAIKQVKDAQVDLAEAGRLIVSTTDTSEWAVRRAIHDVRRAAVTDRADDESVWRIELVTPSEIVGVRERTLLSPADVEAILADPDGEAERRGLKGPFEIQFTREA